MDGTDDSDKKNGTWEQTVTVKAREEYIGGNHVPTNIAPDSSISTGYGDATLPQPKVNVKAELTLSNAEQTIFGRYSPHGGCGFKTAV